VCPRLAAELRRAGRTGGRRARTGRLGPQAHAQEDRPRLRKAFSLRALARRYGINQKTVTKWRKRTSVADERTGPKEAKSTVLTVEEEAVIVTFRRHTLLPLDDCLYALQATIPHLTRSSLHRCLQRHGIGRLPDVKGQEVAKKKFKAYPIGFFHIDIAEVQTAEGRLYLLVAIDRTSKFAFVELHRKATRRVAADFLRHLAEAVPYKVHTVLTDNGTHFTDPTGDGWTPKDIRAMRAEGVLLRCHSFEAACADLDIDHRLTKPLHPWTNGQVERMNRTIKTRRCDATTTTTTLSSSGISRTSSPPTTSAAV
jgi:transposase-like protein